MTPLSKKSSILKIALILVVLLFTETSYATNGNATAANFSQKQITTFISTVTTQLQLSKNWKSNFSDTASSKLYCNSVVLGEGVRAGNHGLYTWFTCSAMHKLDTTKTSSSAIVCTGFSSPVWIQPTRDSINFQAVSYGPEYTTFRTSAPTPVRVLMDSTYNQMNSEKPRVVIARATQGASSSVAANQTNTCQ